MNKKESIKTERFFNKLYDKSVSKSVSKFLMGLLIFLIMLSCLMPIQELLADTESPMLIPVVTTVISFMLVNTRTTPYKHYTENQKSRTMREILQYYPISKKAVWKYKMADLFPFLAKVTGMGMFLQMIVTLIAYKTLSWTNFFYVFLCVFLIPLAEELLFDAITNAFVEE